MGGLFGRWRWEAWRPYCGGRRLAEGPRSLADKVEICRMGGEGSKQRERGLFKRHRESGGQATGSGPEEVTEVRGGGPL